MTKSTVFAASIALATVLGGAAFADGGHDRRGSGRPDAPRSEMPFRENGMGDMMQMMMRMHAGMTGNAMGMTDGKMPGSDMMDSGMMRMMGADGTGAASPEQMRSSLQAKFKEYDADGNGSLSIAEFETLHSAQIRETMVDRFQYFDADGDGAVTAEEIAAPVARMERMQMLRDEMDTRPDGRGITPGMGNGTMMQDN